MFQKKGLDFFSIGGQVNNSSSRDKESINRGFYAIKKYQMNTAAFPVYWSRLEPEEDVFDYSQVDYIIDQAVHNQLKLILLWFGTWKNGASHYAPGWMKRDHKRFPRVIDALGNETMVLTTFSRETCEADIKAFSHFMAHIKEYDKEGCVIAVQVENEPGIHASPRDYSEKAEMLFHGNVPSELSSYVLKKEDSVITSIWEKAGGVKSGNWNSFFGMDAEEIFSAFYFAKYINAVAAAGKKVSDLPLYVNAWVRETRNRVQGVDFPCGGATSLTLGIWKCFAPDIDCLCPDLYFDDRDTYMELCSIYSRPDNPLFIPESRADEINAIHIFEAIEKYGLTGVHAFAIDATLDRQGELTEAGEAYKRSVHILSSMRTLIEQYHGTGRIHAVVQQEYADSMFFDFGEWYGRVYFLNRISDEEYIHLDNQHTDEKYLKYRGKGLIVDAGDGLFYLAGEGFTLVLFPKKRAVQMSSILHGTKTLNANNTPYLSVEEGYFDRKGEFIPERERTGDEDDNGLWVTSDIGVVRVVLDAKTEAGRICQNICI